MIIVVYYTTLLARDDKKEKSKFLISYVHSSCIRFTSAFLPLPLLYVTSSQRYLNLDNLCNQCRYYSFGKTTISFYFASSGTRSLRALLQSSGAHTFTRSPWQSSAMRKYIGKRNESAAHCLAKAGDLIPYQLDFKKTIDLALRFQLSNLS